jgi:diaminobutyrate-2-oxoglutarate transaminase
MRLDFSIRSLGRPFLFLWAGSTVSLVGTLITSFALDVWVFQTTGSAMAFSGMVVASAVPALLVLPWAGSFADRLDRRYILVISTGFEAIIALLLAALLWTESLAIWHLYAFNVVASTVSAFEGPTMQTAVSSMLSKEQLTRANGFSGLTFSLLSIFSPVAAGALIAFIGLPGVVLFELVTSLIACVLIIKAISFMPSNAQSFKLKDAFSVRKVIRNFSGAMIFFWERQLLIGLFVYGLMMGCLIDIISLLGIPLVLSYHTSSELGLIMSIAAIGSLIGSGLLFITEGLRRLALLLLISDLIIAACVMVAGTGSSVLLFAGCAFLGEFAGAIGIGCNSAFWMRKVPLDRQGSIFAAAGTIGLIIAPLATVAGSFVAEHIFEPALAVNGIWADSIGVWFGTGKGRGMSFVFFLCGALGIMLSSAALFQNRFRNMDSIVPDERK